MLIWDKMVAPVISIRSSDFVSMFGSFDPMGFDLGKPVDLRAFMKGEREMPDYDTQLPGNPYDAVFSAGAGSFGYSGRMDGAGYIQSQPVSGSYTAFPSVFNYRQEGPSAGYKKNMVDYSVN